MSMNINEETYRLTKKLAELTGENITTAVTVAVRERLERLQANPKAGMAERLMALGRETAPLLQERLDVD